MSEHKIILDEHAQLDLLLRDLRTVSGWDPKLLQNPRIRGKLAADLESLRGRLRRHFDIEESGAYMQEICSRKPSAGDTLKNLHAEHQTFLQLISSMETTCRQDTHDPFSFAELLVKLSWLLDLLKQHEKEETALIKEVFEM